MKKLTIEDFKERANKVHNNKYVYDKTDLDNRDGDGKVIVTCQIHGDFKVEPNKHLVGIGCSKCANNIKRTKEDFISNLIRKTIKSQLKIIINKHKEINLNINYVKIKI